MKKDIFKEYLESKNKTIALTDRSYKNVNHSLTNEQINSKLATYGDALLKHALCKILFEENVESITEEKKKYESDEVLVNVVAKNYDLVSHIKFDEKDEKIPKNYNYEKKGDDSPHKYIATAVEALLAAIYLDHDEDFDVVVDIVKEWNTLIDKEKKNDSL